MSSQLQQWRRDPAWPTRFWCDVWGCRDQWCVFCIPSLAVCSTRCSQPNLNLAVVTFLPDTVYIFLSYRSTLNASHCHPHSGVRGDILRALVSRSVCHTITFEVLDLEISLLVHLPIVHLKFIYEGHLCPLWDAFLVQILSLLSQIYIMSTCLLPPRCEFAVSLHGSHCIWESTLKQFPVTTETYLQTTKCCCLSTGPKKMDIAYL